MAPKPSSLARHRQVDRLDRAAGLEIIHQVRLLARMSDERAPAEADRYIFRDAQRVVEPLDALVWLRNSEDIYETAAVNSHRLMPWPRALCQ
jgi:hypothetical protein